MAERDCEFVYAVVIRNYGDPNKLLYKIGRSLAKAIKLSFGDGCEVHVGTRKGNAISWTEDVWPKGEA